MKVAKRMAAFFVRPIYRAFFEAPLWRFLRVVKAFFFVEIRVQLDEMERTQREFAARIQRDQIERIQRENYYLIERQKTEIILRNEARSQLESIGRQIGSGDLASQQRWAAIEERLKILESSNIAQWDSLEQLLLALFRQPQLPASEPEEEDIELEHASISSMAKLGRVHAASNIR